MKTQDDPRWHLLESLWYHFCPESLFISSAVNCVPSMSIVDLYSPGTYPHVHIHAAISHNIETTN